MVARPDQRPPKRPVRKTPHYDSELLWLKSTGSRSWSDDAIDWTACEVVGHSASWLPFEPRAREDGGYAYHDVYETPVGEFYARRVRPGGQSIPPSVKTAQGPFYSARDACRYVIGVARLGCLEVFGYPED